MNKLERKLRENDLELANSKRESERNINNLKESNKKYNDDYNKLYNKLINIQDELNNLKEENASLLNQNKSLTNDNESMLAERKYNNEVISDYKRTIEKLKKENNELKSQLKSRKYNVANNSNSYSYNYNSKSNNNIPISSTQVRNSKYEDEIVIINKETTYSKGLFGEPNEFNKYGVIKNKYEIKKNADIKSEDILKLHEIIQDLSNMILIYEKFFFKEKVKPKNNHELFCYLLVQYINEKFLKLKMNAFMNIFYYNQSDKESIPKINYLRRNNSNLGSRSRYENNINTYSDRENSRKRRRYFSKNNRINNEYY